MYVICSDDGYYTGDKFTHEGENFVIFNKDINKAKRYKSLKRCQNACNIMERKYTNCISLYGGLYIKEVEDDD